MSKSGHVSGGLSTFPVLAILVPDRGINPAILPLFFQAPEGAALILIECQGPGPEHGAFTSPENVLIGQAARRSANLVREGMLLEKDQVYIIPAGLYPEVRGDRFVLVNYPYRERHSYLADFILSGLSNSFRNRLTVILTDQTGLLGADIARREGGYVYFLEDPSFRVPAVALPLIDGLAKLEKIGLLLTGDRCRTTNNGVEARRAAYHGKPVVKDNFLSLLMQEVFPLLMKNRQERGPIRVWIAANPNGLTAYSTAIALSEYLRQRKLFSRIRIFSTGLNRREVNQARLGLFDGETLSSFDTTLREQYFIRREDGRYQVSPDLQQNCIFATHHFIANAPFSRCDLVICADPLHLVTDAQRKKLFETFHYAINPCGYLVLPPRIDGPLPPSGLFAPVDSAPGLFIRRSDVPAAGQPAIRPKPCYDAEKEVEKLFLSGYVPAAMLVNDELRVIRFYGVLTPYLRRRQDRPSLHLLKIVRDELLFDLSELLEKVARTRQSAAVDSVWLGDELRPECQLEVVPIPGTPRNHKLIIIREKDGAPRKSAGTPGIRIDGRDRRIKTLEKQVQRLRCQLQTAHHLFRQIQQNLQTTNEEIVAKNAALQSVNEELYSINEDLILRNKDLEMRALQSLPDISPIHRPADCGIQRRFPEKTSHGAEEVPVRLRPKRYPKGRSESTYFA